MSRSRSTRITAAEIASVRKALGETQAEFALRFSRSRFTVIRWEQNGIKFAANSKRVRAWHDAIMDARKLPKGRDGYAGKNLRALLSFSP